MKDFNDFGSVKNLKLTIIIDNYAEKSTPFLAQHGISILIDLENKYGNKKILMDVGPNSLTLFYNMDHLNINCSDIDALFLSHCHYDHTNALIEVLEKADKKMPIIAHPEIFRQTYSQSDLVRYIGLAKKNSKTNIQKAKGHLILVKDPFQITDGVISTGEIERVTDFEGKGIGTFNLDDGKIEPDMIMDDMSIVVNLEDKGLVIITGCSHAGIINIIKHSINITGINKIYGIIGGLHLVDSKDEVINKTIHELKAFDPSIVAAGHCTGINVISQLDKEFEKKFIMIRSGREISLPK